jgi:hypothetical protein
LKYVKLAFKNNPHLQDFWWEKELIFVSSWKWSLHLLVGMIVGEVASLIECIITEGLCYYVSSFYKPLPPSVHKFQNAKWVSLYPQLNPCILVFKWVANSQTITTIKLQQITYFNEPNVHKKSWPFPHLLVGSLIACILNQACIFLVFKKNVKYIKIILIWNIFSL